jgi:pimeloyl-ACP methyl ester carboxylesterase
MYPGDVASMVLASPGSMTRHYPAKYRNLTAPVVGEMLIRFMERRHINALIKWIMFDETAISSTLERQTYQPFTEKDARLGLLNLMRDYQDIHVFSNLSKIFCPVKIIWGDFDKGHPINMSGLFLKKIEGSSFSTINNSGHLVHEERPKMVCDIIDRFIAYNS